MITYDVEPWLQFKREAARLFPLHWEEIAINRDKIRLAVDYERYDQLDATGQLHVVVARSDGDVVGYHLTLVQPHLHYADVLHGFTDVYFIVREFRRGRTGINLFRFVEKTLKARGVKKLFTGTKIHMDLSPMFKRMGWTPTETLFTKYIGD